MKPTPYLKQVLRELDRELKRFPRSERAQVLEAYKHGLETSFYGCYPNRFPSVAPIEISEVYRGFYERGTHMGKQFGVFEVDSARELLLDEVEKRKTRFSGPSGLDWYLGQFAKMMNPWEWL